MYADQISTNIADPATILIPDEMPDAGLLNLYQILYHAHAIFLTISLIKIFQALTWKGRTGMITVFPLAFCAETQSANPAAFSVTLQAAITFILCSDISYAEPTVHATWCDFRYPDTCFHVGFYFRLFV